MHLAPELEFPEKLVATPDFEERFARQRKRLFRICDFASRVKFCFCWTTINYPVLFSCAWFSLLFVSWWILWWEREKRDFLFYCWVMLRALIVQALILSSIHCSVVRITPILDREASLINVRGPISFGCPRTSAPKGIILFRLRHFCTLCSPWNL